MVRQAYCRRMESVSSSGMRQVRGRGRTNKASSAAQYGGAQPYVNGRSFN
jgi:hypothetical protein